MTKPLLEVKGLKTFFYTDRGTVRAVDDVSFKIREGQTLSLVGESGCGKSVTALSIIKLIPDPPGKIAAGSILFDGKNLIDLPEKKMRRIRGNEISMIFQEPMTSLNPVFRVGDQIGEVLKLHRDLSKKDALDKTVELLTQVGIPSPAKRVFDYPHQMSGGMRQRVMIAMALACDPRLIIADEPTTALDVTIQAQILELMERLSEDTGTAILLITHDLGVVSETARHVVVMYAGRVVEEAEVSALFANPLHPYTQGLILSLPGISSKGGASLEKNSRRLEAIPGLVPSLLNLPVGCKFTDRCKHAMDRCAKEEPDLTDQEQGHSVRCWLYEEA